MCSDILTFVNYYLLHFHQFKSTKSYVWPIHYSKFSPYYVFFLPYLMQRGNYILNLHLINQILQLILKQIVMYSWGRYWLDSLYSSSLFIFNRTYLFSKYFETTNKRLYKFANYKIARIVPKFVYVRPFNRQRHLVRLLSKELSVLNFQTLKIKCINFFFNFFFNKDLLSVNSFIHSIQVLIFCQNKGTVFFK